MGKKSTTDDAARLSMDCPFCDEPAMVKGCRPGTRGAIGQDWYWRCICGSRGFFPDAHYRQLDKMGKIKLLKS